MIQICSILIEFSNSLRGHNWIKISSILWMSSQPPRLAQHCSLTRPRTRSSSQLPSLVVSSRQDNIRNALETLDNEHSFMLLQPQSELSHQLLCLRSSLAHQLQQHQFCLPFVEKSLEKMPNCKRCITVYLSHFQIIPVEERILTEEMLKVLEKQSQQLDFVIQRLPSLLPNYSVYNNLVNQLKEKGSEMAKIGIVQVSVQRRIIALSKIQKNEKILFIPKAQLITLELTRTLPLVEKLIEARTLLRSPKHTQLAIFLLEQFQLGRQSRFNSYLSALPNSFGHFPVNFGEEVLAELKGSSFLQQIEQKKLDLRRDYDAIVAIDEKFSRFRFEKFVEARMLVSSRVFGIVVEDVKTDALVPVADMLNHNIPKQTSWYYCNEEEGFIIQSLKEIDAGSEVFDSYGQKCNSRFLLHYGFVLPNNSHNQVALDIDLSSLFQGQPRTAKVRINRFIDSKGFEEMLGLLRATIDFQQNVSEGSEQMGLNIESLRHTEFRSIENEKQVWAKVENLVSTKLKGYPQTILEDKRLLQHQQDNNRCNVILLRKGQKEVLAFYQTMSRKIMRYLQSDGRRGDVSAYQNYIDTIHFGDSSSH